jgi:FkbM family methyltransferase
MTTLNFHSQYQEDVILNNIFKGKKDGVCVEVGGFDGVTGSNTFFFEKHGWKCMVIEPMPNYCEAIRKVRSCIVAEYAASTKEGVVDFYVAEGVETLSTMEFSETHFSRIKETPNSRLNKIQVKTKKLDTILKEKGFIDIDFITIDVEGHELSVLAGLDFESSNIKIFIIEDNSNGFDDSVKSLMASKGYKRFKKTGCNDWFTNDTSIYSWTDVFYTELKISIFTIKQRIKPYVPSFLKRKS